MAIASSEEISDSPGLDPVVGAAGIDLGWLSERIPYVRYQECVHCGLCAERCPTSAWDMQKYVLYQPYAGKPALP